MKHSIVIKLHIGEETFIDEFGINVKLLHFKEYSPGKKYEEYGDKTDIVIRFQNSDEIKDVKFYWYERTFEEEKHFRIFQYEFFIFEGSLGFLPKGKDETGDWVKFVLIESDELEMIDYSALRDRLLRMNR